MLKLRYHFADYELKTWEKVAISLTAVLFVVIVLGLTWTGLALLMKFIWSWFAAAFGWPPMPLWVAFGVVFLLWLVSGPKSYRK